MTLTQPFGIDAARYDGLIDWTALENHIPKVEFMAFRCTISWGYRDPFFLANWREAGRRGIPRMAYHAIYPDQPVTNQVDNFWGHIGSDWTDHDRAVLDLELDHGMSKTAITNSTILHAEKFKAKTGRFPILYARTIWLRDHAYPAKLNHLDLWIALYKADTPGTIYADEHPGPVPLPEGFNSYLIHQTGHHTPAFCATTTKVHQDYNRWNGTSEDVLKYFGLDEPEPAPTKPLTLESLNERLTIVERKVGIT